MRHWVVTLKIITPDDVTKDKVDEQVQSSFRGQHSASHSWGVTISSAKEHCSQCGDLGYTWRLCNDGNGQFDQVREPCDKCNS